MGATKSCFPVFSETFSHMPGGDIKYLNCLVTSQTHVIEGPCMAGSSSLYVATLQSYVRPWHDARAIARARAITRASQEKGSLGGR